MECQRLQILLFMIAGLWHASYGQTALVTTTQELYKALSDSEVTNIFLPDSLTVNSSEWNGTVHLRRSVLFTATAERLTTLTYVLLDFKDLVMMFELGAGLTIKYFGLELVDHLDPVEPNFRPLRLSPGANLVFENCILRRRVGLPYKAALVNLINAPYPNGTYTEQGSSIGSNLTYRSTRSTTPIVLPTYINVSDVYRTLPADSSLAYQGLFYGGYAYRVVRSYYAADSVVSDECMAQRSGRECITLMLQQLQKGGSEGEGEEQGSGAAARSQTMKIVVATIITIGTVLLAAAVGAFIYRRRVRRRRRQQQQHQRAPSGDSDPVPGSAIKSRHQSSLGVAGYGVHGGGCVFLGLEEDQQLPEWHAVAADVEEEEEADEEAHAVVNTLLPAAACASSAMSPRHGAGLSPASPSSGEISGVRSFGMMRPAVLTAGAAPPADNPGRAALHNALGGGGGGGAAAATSASASASGEGALSPSRQLGSDVQAELTQLASELRRTVQDEAVKLEAVIGCGTYGTVYKGTWRGLSVAVKTLVFSVSEDSRRRALQEAALCASISHPNVVATYASDLQPLGAVCARSSQLSRQTTLGVGSTSGATVSPTHRGPSSSSGPSGEQELSQLVEWRLYIIQEYADGGPLRSLYGDKNLWPAPGEVNMRAIVGLALGISRSLAYLHSKRIVHGDLNPNNVLLKRDDAEPSGYSVKVADFGLSVMLPSHRSHLSNLHMGTMFYICPAVVMKGHVGPLSDVFALGVLLWELYHGRSAGRRTPQGPRYVSTFPAFAPASPEAYRSVAAHCLQRHPHRRPAAAVVTEQLEALMRSLQATDTAGGSA